MLAACQNVADTLTALEQDAEALKAAANSDADAKTTLDITQDQLKADLVSVLRDPNTPRTTVP